LRIATDPDYKFELAVQLGELGVAREIVETENMAAGENKWKQLGELAMSGGDIELASACLAKSGDLSGQLLLCSATASPARLEELAVTARKKGKNNVAFVCFFLLNKIDDCIELLCETGRVPEAAFMARTYAPSKVSDVVALWKADLAKVNKKAAEALADPLEYKNLFPDFDLALRAEQAVRAKASVPREPASSFPQSKNIGGQDLIEEIKGLTITHGDVDLGAVPSEASPAPEPLVESKPESTPDQEFAAQPAPEPAPQVEQEPEPQVEQEPEQQVEQEPEPPTQDSAASPEEDLPDADGDDDDWGLTD
jgi:coatomer subunit beta'